MKIHVSIPITISMELDDVMHMSEVKEKVKEICANPSIISKAIDDTKEDIPIHLIIEKEK